MSRKQIIFATRNCIKKHGFCQGFYEEKNPFMA